MTEEIHLGVYERLLKDYESDKGKYAADLAYAACCLSDTVTSEEIARNENDVTFEVGLPLTFSVIDEEVLKEYLSKPANGPDKLKEFLEGINSDSDKLLDYCEKMGDNWYSKFFTWVKFCEMEANFDNEKDIEKWKNEILFLWECSKSDRIKVLFCLKVLFCGEYGSLYLKKPPKESKDPWHRSFYLAQKIIEDSIQTFTNGETKNPFALFLLGNLLENAGWKNIHDYREIYKYCGNMGISQAHATLALILCQENRKSGTGSIKKEITDFYRKGALLGNAECQYNLAIRYESGNGVSRNVSEAIKWYNEAAIQNINRYKLYKEDKECAGNEMYLLYCYSKRLGKESEWFKASFLESAFNKGNPASALILGEMELNRNPNKAITLFQKAGDFGLEILSKIKLAEMAEKGHYSKDKASDLYCQVLKSEDMDYTSYTYELYSAVKGIKRSGYSLPEIFNIGSTYYYGNETHHLIDILSQTLKTSREMIPPDGDVKQITDESEIEVCQNLLRLHFADSCTQIVESITGAKDGSGRGSILWFEKYRIWSKSRYGSNYYLNSFGIQSPLEKPHLNITVQINPAYEGASGKTAGGFVMDKNNRVYLIHTGEIGGGKEGIGLKAFWNKYRGITAELKKQRNSTKVAVIAELGTTNFVQCIAEFVKFVANDIKENKTKDVTTQDGIKEIKSQTKLLSKFELQKLTKEAISTSNPGEYPVKVLIERIQSNISLRGYEWNPEYEKTIREYLV